MTKKNPETGSGLLNIIDRYYLMISLLRGSKVKVWETNGRIYRNKSKITTRN